MSCPHHGRREPKGTRGVRVWLLLPLFHAGGQGSAVDDVHVVGGAGEGDEKVADAVAEGLIQRSPGRSGEEAEAEPMPDWERELLAQGDNAAAEAPETSEAPAKTESE